MSVLTVLGYPGCMLMVVVVECETGGIGAPGRSSYKRTPAVVAQTVLKKKEPKLREL